jgi:hypothetical protein
MVVNSFFADFELFLQFLRPNFVGSRFLSASAQTAPKIKRIAAFLPSNSAKKISSVYRICPPRLSSDARPYYGLAFKPKAYYPNPRA